MTGKEIVINGPDGQFGGYLASPSTGSGAGIVVIQEIFGVNKVMRDVADSFAARGYFALAPDLFWRLEPGVQLTDKSDAEWKRAFALMQKFDPDKGVSDIQATIRHLRGLDGASGKVEPAKMADRGLDVAHALVGIELLHQREGTLPLGVGFVGELNAW